MQSLYTCKLFATLFKRRFMKHLFLLSIFTVNIFFILIGCSKNVSPMKTGNPQSLQKEWKHSYEESAGNVEIYRPADYKVFTPSKFRQIYKLMAGGKCEYLVLHPADAHYMATGTWTYDPEANTVQIKNDKGERVVQFEVLDISNDIMKIQIVR